MRALDSANMLVPAPYDPEWTSLASTFDGAVAPGSAEAIAGAGATGATQSIGAASTGAALPTNPCRSCLIIQNNSATGGPVLWWNLGQPASEYNGFALQPGSSVVIAEPKACPKEAVYIKFVGSGAAYSTLYQNTDQEACAKIAAAKAAIVKSGNVGAESWGYPPTAFPPPAQPVAAPAPSSYQYGGFKVS